MGNSMLCPKCQNKMEQVETPFGEIERCTSCKGLWIDAFEQEEMVQIAGGIDIGSKTVGKENNQIGKIKCPCCRNSQMLRMVDAKQPHIWYESCPSCYGRYYDAGELTDLSKNTLSDFLKKLTLKERK
jgi:Zn-finger nucleic acid-binding protein